MTAQASADRDAAPGPVAPATIVRVLVRPLTKILNPLMVRLAGRRFFPMALILRWAARSYSAGVVSWVVEHGSFRATAREGAL